MVRKLDYYSGISIDRVKQTVEQIVHEFEEIKRSYAVGAPHHGKPLQYQHRISIDTIVYDIDVLRNERAVKEEILHHPDPQYTVSSTLDQLEREIKEFIESFP